MCVCVRVASTPVSESDVAAAPDGIEVLRKRRQKITDRLSALHNSRVSARSQTEQVRL